MTEILGPSGKPINPKAGDNVLKKHIQKQQDKIESLAEDCRMLHGMVKHLHLVAAYCQQELPSDHKFQPALVAVLDNLNSLNEQPPQEVIDSCINALIDHCKGEH